MVRILPLEDIAQRRARGAIRAYLERAQNLTWVIGMVRGLERYALSALMTEFSDCRKTPRYRELRDALERKLE